MHALIRVLRRAAQRGWGSRVLLACGLLLAACASALSVSVPADAAADPLSPCTATLGIHTVGAHCLDPSKRAGRAATARSKNGISPSGKGDGCVATVISAAQARGLGLSKAPKGESWALYRCNVGWTEANGKLRLGPFILVGTSTGKPPRGGATPPVTPQQLLVQALGELQVPKLSPGTAPPRGSEGLVGLPEWFWIPAASWHPLQLTVRAGPVWATVTATPQTLSFRPAAGMSAVTCAGPGTTYNPDESAAVQHTNCSYTFQQDSAAQPGGAYDATLSVSWRITWTGSGGAGGLVDRAMARSTALTIKVTQAEALVTTP